MVGFTRLGRWAAIAMLLLAASGCSHPRDVSRDLLGDVRAALATSEQVASRRAPLELADCRERLQAFESAFAQRNYEPIVRDGLRLLQDVQHLATTAAAREDAAIRAEWARMTEAVPRAQQQISEWLSRTGTKSQTSSNDALQQVARDLEAARALWRAADSARRADPENATAGLIEGRESAVHTLALLEQTHFPKRNTP